MLPGPRHPYSFLDFHEGYVHCRHNSITSFLIREASFVTEPHHPIHTRVQVSIPNNAPSFTPDPCIAAWQCHSSGRPARALSLAPGGSSDTHIETPSARLIAGLRVTLACESLRWYVRGVFVASTRWTKIGSVPRTSTRAIDQTPLSSHEGMEDVGGARWRESSLWTIHPSRFDRKPPGLACALLVGVLGSSPLLEAIPDDEHNRHPVSPAYPCARPVLECGSPSRIWPFATERGEDWLPW